MPFDDLVDHDFEGGGLLSDDGFALWPDLEHVCWSLADGTSANPWSNDPGREVQPAVFGIHLPCIILKMSGIDRAGSEDQQGRRVWRTGRRGQVGWRSALWIHRKKGYAAPFLSLLQVAPRLGSPPSVAKFAV